MLALNTRSLTRLIAAAGVAGALMTAIVEPAAQADIANPHGVERAMPSALEADRMIETALAALDLGDRDGLSALPDATFGAAHPLRQARPPVGYVRFCEAMPGRCAAFGTNAPITLDAARWRELDAVNRHVNGAVIAVTDERLYARREVWSYPRSTRLRLADGAVVRAPAGDCEDYVLLKRDILIRRGWPAGALLITVVRDHEGLGHAVLTVRTDRGDLVLDNQAETVMGWRETGYGFIKRQSMHDPSVWVRLGTPSDLSTVATAGTQ